VPEPDRLAGRGCLGLFLVEGGGGGGTGRPIGLSNFRVIAVLLRDHMLAPGRGVPVACVYEGMCGWRDVSCTWRGDINIPKTSSSFCFAGRANGSLYWAIRGARAALVLDEATTGVSRVDLPVAIHPWYPRSRCFQVIGGEDDAVSLRAVHMMVPGQCAALLRRPQDDGGGVRAAGDHGLRGRCLPVRAAVAADLGLGGHSGQFKPKYCSTRSC
jgi:hypothetical protein